MTFTGNTSTVSSRMTAPGATSSPASSRKNASTIDDSAEQAFFLEAKKSPIDRIRETILKKHVLTQAEFDALPAKEQATILREMEEATKQAINGARSGRTPMGMNANVLA